MVYKIKFRRRRERKTDYKARLSLLRSFMPRVIIRKTNRYIIAQLVESKEAQDFVLCTANSKELLQHGWQDKNSGSLKSLPAAYLTGILLAAKISGKKINVKKAIVDMGISKSTKGSRLFACVKGLVDAGMNVPCSKEIMPDESRINGRHMKREIPVGDIKQKLLDKIKK
ncbi:MAG: 50S ribosomal protein L18 [archaeon]